ncbi:MAG: 1,4-alpha-glucan branching protein GlgB [Gammaproteobacteria bacterium]|jgi:1,4-alpha-glucan branching enzyme|nr:1,4-alpha-glucan branching protein GlgB [Gammaproteobacteria bacterium]
MLQDHPDKPAATAFSADVQRLIDTRHHEPFALLGKHNFNDMDLVRAFIPGAAWVRIAENGATMQRMGNTDLFAWHGPANQVPDRYRLIWKDSHGAEHVAYDPYCFPLQISDFDLHLFAEGSHWHIYRVLGAHKAKVDGIHGVRFAVWAPSAERVSVVGDFNNWDGRCHAMQVLGNSGVWEIFMPGLGGGQPYKYEIRTRDQGLIHLKTDPYGQHFEMRPATASRVPAQHPYSWEDDVWMQRRRLSNWQKDPVSIYEVHLGSWKRDEHGNFLNYRQLATELVEHLKRTGFTHIELLPVTEHPLDASWGYQTTGYFAPTSRFGEPDDFRFFVDHCHQHNIGVLLDWVPAHFPRDAHGLANFDGTSLYEHQDPRRGEHSDWGTLIYNFGRNEVKNFLLSSAVYWLEEFHLDGLRVDAVASMLYHDYSRNAGEWLPNIYGGRENLEAVAFLRELNTITHAEFPGTMIIAEESTAWPGVSRPADSGGLGFSMKWNMGWMHDTLRYMSHEPVHRKYHHNDLTFGLLYAFTENFVLPFSHDEVVHGKRSMLYKQPGDDWQRLANLRLLYTYMFTFPGKKLLFMGNEIAQGREWNSEASIEWYLLEYDGHRGMLTLISDLNQLYRDNPELHRADFTADGFEWLDSNASETSVLSYLRRDGDSAVIVVLNFTPVPRYGYRVGVPVEGHYRELLNSDSSYYSGTDVGNSGQITTEAVAYNGHSHSLLLTLPPLAGIVLKRQHD